MRLLALLLCACGGVSEPDAIIHGARVYWGAHVYPDAADYLGACRDVVGSLDTAIHYEPSPAQVRYDCMAHQPIAGCAWSGTALVLDAPTIWETATCHEVVHAVRLPRDYGHADPVWKRLSAAGLNGQERK